MSNQLIVVVEDEEDIREVLLYNLRREGYDALGFESGPEGLEGIRSKNPDLVILDLMLPGLDGLTICQQIRQDPALTSIPVIIVTAKEEESDLVIGLALGADDYIKKPFSSRELMARVRSLLRRTGRAGVNQDQQRIIVDDLLIEVDRHQVSLAGESIVFTATEFKLLYQLASNLGKALSREQLLSRVMRDGVIVVDRNIDVHIRRVRKKLGDYAVRIQTIRGIGYRFVSKAGVR
jgi:DNA-binding response OmpR family regulator